MSDASDYFRSYAVRALCRARAMPIGRHRRIQRLIARVYHLLARESALGSTVDQLEHFRAVRKVEEGLR